MERKNYFIELNSINVNDKIEKKNGLNYLSWAWAWAEVKKLYPDANYKIYETSNGCIYWNDGKTAWVKTGVIINNIEHIEYLPIMDFKNKSILLDNITSFDVNKTIQRSLTKACARHGIGLYVYAGEDLPEDDNLTSKVLDKFPNAITMITKEQEKIIDDNEWDKATICSYASAKFKREIKSIKDLHENEAKILIDAKLNK